MRTLLDLHIDFSRTEDDPTLWDTVVAHLLSWIDPQLDLTRRRPLFIRLRQRPHYWRHTLAGSKGWPRGYGAAGSPQLDWSVLLQWQPKEHTWRTVTGLHTKRYYLLQVAIPSRSTRHNQALVHCRWLPGPRRIHTEEAEILFHFRRISGHWQFNDEIALSQKTAA
jgi:hypothetical protein